MARGKLEKFARSFPYDELINKIFDSSAIVPDHRNELDSILDEILDKFLQSLGDSMKTNQHNFSGVGHLRERSLTAAPTLGIFFNQPFC